MHNTYLERKSFIMTFFNNIKRGATDAANKAAKKTGEITNIAKLTMNIKTAEAKLGDVYEEIGRLFYTAERTGEDFTGEIASNIMKADKIKADIANFKAELAVLRNVIVCESCGNEINADAAFCSFCGAKVERPAPIVEETAEDETDCCCEDTCECADSTDSTDTDECTCECSDEDCTCEDTEKVSGDDTAE